MSDSLVIRANCSQKTSNSLKILIFRIFPHSLQKSDREQFAQGAHDKRPRAAIRSFSQANHSFAQKTDERFPNPAILSLQASPCLDREY